MQTSAKTKVKQTSKYTMPSLASSPDKFEALNNFDSEMHFGIKCEEEGEEEEVQIAPRLEFEEGGFDQDFDFIEDDITNFYTEIQQKDPVLSHVQKAIEKGKRKIPENLKDIMISEVKNLEENFQKVITYSCKYKK